MAEEGHGLVIPDKDDMAYSENKMAAALQGEEPPPPPATATKGGKRKKPAIDLTSDDGVLPELAPKKRKYVKKVFVPQFEWEKDYIKYFGEMLSRGNAIKAITLLRTLSQTNGFTVRDNQTLAYKNKNLGNIFLLMYFLFLTEKTEKLMKKRNTELKKALAIEEVKI
jgi:hypothetical protein